MVYEGQDLSNPVSLFMDLNKSIPVENKQQAKYSIPIGLQTAIMLDDYH